MIAENCFETAARGAGGTFSDLFCGAGGLSLGFIQAGFTCNAAVDNWQAAIATYSANIGRHAALADITPEFAPPKSSVILGGPPCQGFSSAGLRREDDQRNSLIETFASIVVRALPEAFVFENVEGFLTSMKGSCVVQLLAPLVGAGYRIHLRKVNAANYGVPQHRKRVVAVGGLGWDPTFPDPTHSAFGAPGAGLTARPLPPTTTLSDALDGLPAAGASRGCVLRDHAVRALGGIDLERVHLLKPGQRMRDLPEELWHASYRRRAFRRVMDGTPSERRGGAPSGIRRLRPDQPCKAITGASSAEFIHPAEDRPLTLRECARVQTFPDWFDFIGTRAERALLIGNAMPPRLAEIFALSLSEDLKVLPDCRRQGALLSFVATLSEGVSPALRTTLEAVERAFYRPDARPIQLRLWD